MTKDELDAIRARVEAATPGPWEAGTAFCCPDMGWIDGPRRMVCPVHETAKRTHTLDSNDAEFIAAAREDVPALLAEVERLTTEVEAKVTQNVALVGMNGRLQQKVERLTGLLDKATDDHIESQRNGAQEAIARKAAEAEVERLTKLTEETEAQMHLRIRAGYDKTVADSWRAWAEKQSKAAFQRGVAAMREAAAAHASSFAQSSVCGPTVRGVAEEIRALPDPEDKP